MLPGKVKHIHSGGDLTLLAFSSMVFLNLFYYKLSIKEKNYYGCSTGSSETAIKNRKDCKKIIGIFGKSGQFHE